MILRYDVQFRNVAADVFVHIVVVDAVADGAGAVRSKVVFHVHVPGVRTHNVESDLKLAKKVPRPKCDLATNTAEPWLHAYRISTELVE